MKREEFVGYVASRAGQIGIPVHQEGELKGLPREFHHSIAIAYLLDALGQDAPSGEELRAWYGAAASASPMTARWVIRVVGSLRNPDLEKLDIDELLAFWPLFEGWAGMAHGLANDRCRKPEPCQPV